MAGSDCMGVAACGPAPTDPAAASERGTAVCWLLAAPHLCCH